VKLMAERAAAILTPSAHEASAEPLQRRARKSNLLKRVLAVRLAWVGVVVMVVLVLLAVGADVISPYSPLLQDHMAPLEAPSWRHLFGTDELGRDVLSRVIHGSRISLAVSATAVLIAAGLGVTLGLMAGFWGGWADEALMRLTDALYAFPALVLALAITAALGPSIINAMIAIGIVFMPAYSRLVRGQALSVRERDFVTAAKVAGARPLRIMVQHIWPNVTAPIIVQASLSVSFAIITEASLSFLGVGAPPPTPTWGSMLRTGYGYMTLAPWLSIFPGAAIFITVLGFNLLGDGLRSALDPRLRDRGTN
jgi:peptide/nickel transport system permease protein